MKNKEIEIEIKNDIVQIRFSGDKPITYNLSTPMLRAAIEYYCTEKIDWPSERGVTVPVRMVTDPKEIKHVEELISRTGKYVRYDRDTP